MSKFLLALGFVAALAAPAAAGRLDVDPSLLPGASQSSQLPEASVDTTTTQSIGAGEERYQAPAASTDKQRGAQSEFFGANG